MKNMATSQNKKAVEEQFSKISTLTMSFVLFSSLILDLLGFTVILPLMPRLLEHYGSNETADGLYISMKESVSGFRELVGAPDTPKWNSVLFGGILGSLFSLLQFLASPFIGAASDVYGRKPLLVITMLGIATSYFTWLNATTFTWFVVSRIIGGLAKGNVSLSTAVVADVYPVAERGRGMAVIAISFSLGFLVGPLIGVGFINYQPEWLSHSEFFVGPALFALTMAAIDIVYIIVAFPETLPANKRAKSIFQANMNPLTLINPISLFGFSIVRNVPPKESQTMKKIGVLYFLFLFLFSGLEYTLTFLTYLRFNYSTTQQGKMFFIMGLVMIFVQGGYTRRLTAGKELRTAIMGVVALMPAFVLIGYANSALPFYTGLLLFSFSSATVFPTMTTLVSLCGGQSQKGAVMGVFRALGALARALGPLAASFAFWSLGAELTYSLGAVLLVFPLLGLFTVSPKPRDHPE